MSFEIVVACDARHGIGKNGSLPWRLSADLKHFKAVTLGKPVIMGRKTFESIGKPLPERTNIVVTRDPQFHADGIAIAHSLDDALAQGRAAPEMMLIGGAQLYTQALPRTQRLYLTLIHADIDGDAHFPDYDPAAWRETAREDHVPDENNHYSYSFLILER